MYNSCHVLLKNRKMAKSVVELLSSIVCISIGMAAHGQSQSIRLVGGSSSFEGRVEIFQGGEWGTVCDNSWDDNDARVVCRELGIPSVCAVALTNNEYGEGTGPILLDDVNCYGFEPYLDWCQSSERSNNCVHSQDAGVQCGGFGSCNVYRNNPNALATATFEEGSSSYDTYACEGDPESNVHIIGVYEGPVHTRPPSPGDIQVRVTGGDQGPLTLVFSSYEPVRWLVSVDEGIFISKLVLTGYYLDLSSVELQSLWHANVLVCREHPRSYYGYGRNSGEFIEFVRNKYGDIGSFSGIYKADRWVLTVPGEIPIINSTSLPLPIMPTSCPPNNMPPSYPPNIMPTSCPPNNMPPSYPPNIMPTSFPPNITPTSLLLPSVPVTTEGPPRTSSRIIGAISFVGISLLLLLFIGIVMAYRSYTKAKPTNSSVVHGAELTQTNVGSIPTTCIRDTPNPPAITERAPISSLPSLRPDTALALPPPSYSDHHRYGHPRGSAAQGHALSSV